MNEELIRIILLIAVFLLRLDVETLADIAGNTCSLAVTALIYTKNDNGNCKRNNRDYKRYNA